MSTTSAPTELTSDGLGTISDITSDITSSTSPDDSPDNDDEVTEAFLRRHRDALAGDMAKGGGEHLDALAILLKIDENNKQGFFDATRQNFDKIFSNDQVDEKTLLRRLNLLSASLTDTKQRG